MRSETNQMILKQAVDCLVQGDIAGAETSANAVLAATGHRDEDALHLMGLVRMRQGQWNDAVDFLTTAGQAKPHQPVLLLQLGQALAMAHQPEPAIAALSEAVALKPDFAEAWYELANQQLLLNQLSQAEYSYQRTIEMQPGHGPALLGLGRTLNGLARHELAIAVLSKAASQPHVTELMAAILDQLLIAQIRERRQQAALETITRLAVLQPGRTDLDLLQADILREMAPLDMPQA